MTDNYNDNHYLDNQDWADPDGEGAFFKEVLSEDEIFSEDELFSEDVPVGAEDFSDVDFSDDDFSDADFSGDDFSDDDISFEETAPKAGRGSFRKPERTKNAPKKDIGETLSDSVEAIKSGDPKFIALGIGILGTILSFNGIETWGVCGLLAIVLSAFGLNFIRKKCVGDDSSSKVTLAAKILCGIGLGAGIACLVIGILLGIIAALAAKANA